jgi:hypothetical protein
VILGTVIQRAILQRFPLSEQDIELIDRSRKESQGRISLSRQLATQLSLKGLSAEANTTADNTIGASTT